MPANRSMYPGGGSVGVRSLVLFYYGYWGRDEVGMLISFKDSQGEFGCWEPGIRYRCIMCLMYIYIFVYRGERNIKGREGQFLTGDLLSLVMGRRGGNYRG